MDFPAVRTVSTVVVLVLVGMSSGVFFLLFHKQSPYERQTHRSANRGSKIHIQSGKGKALCVPYYSCRSRLVFMWVRHCCYSAVRVEVVFVFCFAFIFLFCEFIFLFFLFRTVEHLRKVSGSKELAAN